MGKMAQLVQNWPTVQETQVQTLAREEIYFEYIIILAPLEKAI